MSLILSKTIYLILPLFTLFPCSLFFANFIFRQFEDWVVVINLIKWTYGTSNQMDGVDALCSLTVPFKRNSEETSKPAYISFTIYLHTTLYYSTSYLLELSILITFRNTHLLDLL